MSWNVLRNDYIKIYRNEFTAAELSDMAAFYQTPTGKKFVAKQHIIMLKTMQTGGKHD